MSKEQWIDENEKLKDENLALNKYVDELLEENRQLKKERDHVANRVLTLEVAYRNTIDVMQKVLAGS